MNKARISKVAASIQPAQQRQGRRPTARSERTRHEVLDAAALCIAREGFAAATTTRIAERAGVSWGVLQYHFGDKDGLMLAVLEYGMDQTESLFTEVITVGIDANSLEERLRILTNEAWQIYSSPLARAATEIVINYRGKWQQDPDKNRYLLELNRTQTRLARRALYCAIGDKKVAHFLAGIFLAALHGFEASLLQYGPGHAFQKERDALVQVMVTYAQGAVL